ncbi:aldo/keto reductase [Candidatus Marinarcus aquaticus]|uniref:Aldo/keto reductase n=1 Tax=Candidatus Marinarcus aquaticus TaxID=2044504 RepID=A0A4Q0XNN9_9BACT|nr:aldo/keto reductase [Candidatus Marinarcus aquaticus]RXJ54156.1 aldo/keto reductase [Candidatus Marinarcus aquaticus]
MKYNNLSNTGLFVSELCLGTMTFGGNRGGFWEHIGKADQEEVNSIVKTAFESGINFIDTANIYSYGESEQLLGQALKDLNIPRDELVIATKVRSMMKEKPNHSGLSRYHIFNSVEDSLKRLQMEHVDILYVHGTDSTTNIEEIMRSLNDIVQSGKVRYLGVCNWPAWMVMKANAIASKNGWHQFVALQYHYSLSARDIERELIPLALDQNLSIMPWSPLSGGFLSGKYTKEVETKDARRANFDFPPLNKDKSYEIIDVLKEIAKARQVSAAQVALAWVEAQKAVTSTIIGAKRVDQLKDNIESTNIILNEMELERLDKISALNKEYPQWMVERFRDIDGK